MTALLEHAVRTVEEITLGLQPDGDLPTMLFTQGPRGVEVMTLAAGGDEYIDDVALAMAANIAVMGATEAVLASAARVPPSDDHGAEVSSRRPIGTEVLLILQATRDMEQTMLADVIRREAEPPAMGDWDVNPADAARVLGGFDRAIRFGLVLADDLTKPEQREAAEAIDHIVGTDGPEAAMRVIISTWRQSAEGAMRSGDGSAP